MLARTAVRKTPSAAAVACRYAHAGRTHKKQPLFSSDPEPVVGGKGKGRAYDSLPRAPRPFLRSSSQGTAGPSTPRTRTRTHKANKVDIVHRTPSIHQVRNVLVKRLREWARAPRTRERLLLCGLDDGQVDDTLWSWASAQVDALDSFGDARQLKSSTAPLNGNGDSVLPGWDVERLQIAMTTRPDWPTEIDTIILRRFLTHLSALPSTPASLRSRLAEIIQITDLTDIASRFTAAREMRRHFHLHIGPTNSGKTYNALRALSRAETGTYAGPLRLLAHEVWDRMNRGTVAGLEQGQGRACNLITGEERRVVDPKAGLTSCTVEMLSLTEQMDVAVIDEIQMIGDPQRGGAWTTAVLGLLAREIHLCGEETVVHLIERMVYAMGDELTIHRYQRLTPLRVADESLEGDLARIEDGDCIVSFSRSGIFNLKRNIEATAGKRCAVVYGALPPETRSEQARLFNEVGNGVNVMVASDAVGMGLNLKIKRMIFETLHKFNGKQEVMMSISQIKQIAGRAGRYGQHDADSGGGYVTTLTPNDLPLLKDVLQAPLTPVHRAVLDANSTIIPKLSVLLPPETTHAQLLDQVASLALAPTYCVPADTSSSAQIASVIEQYHDSLTLPELMMFIFAPVNTRDERVAAAFQAYIEQFVDAGHVDMVAALPIGLMDNLERVELARQALPDADHLESRVTSGEQHRHIPVTIPPAIVAGLPMLESLHKAIVLYLWLSFRMDLAFPDRQQAAALKLRVEDALEFCLERLPGLKQKKRGNKFKGNSRAEREGEIELVRATQNTKINYLTADQLREAKSRIRSQSTDVLQDV
ncbi:hypothetical protein QFC19_003731 [Naganishia cerealis]|uniref:Uncharacterized protein n=1 Tax=Naganishia cerealis TaxID=610337 RepID=A0ACC2W248_9TREE|nr:hypothetical protein QFC19_003731 [Naganishia cerealis]